MTREELTARVDELAGRPTFVADMEELAGELTESERELLGRILLERADSDGAFVRAWDERDLAKGWLRRRLAAADDRARELRAERER